MVLYIYKVTPFYLICFFSVYLRRFSLGLPINSYVPLFVLRGGLSLTAVKQKCETNNNNGLLSTGDIFT